MRYLFRPELRKGLVKLMPNVNMAARAYNTGAVHKTVRQQEADVFHLVIAKLQGARQSSQIARVRALADNRRLWMVVADLVRDDRNPLPKATRAGLISIGRTVQREMDADEPNFDFLITINKQIAEGLSGNP
jgi:flagellar biosynthesis regulator FlaF